MLSQAYWGEGILEQLGWGFWGGFECSAVNATQNAAGSGVLAEAVKVLSLGEWMLAPNVWVPYRTCPSRRLPGAELGLHTSLYLPPKPRLSLLQHLSPPPWYLSYLSPVLSLWHLLG